ncbi:hypothetical protein, partial [Klebsiella pneumoniae]|uniref:hypothetical protein n=1 Tax=Klebsiella pneumoniae TaxID=573 RepID=UPI003013F842
MAQQLSQIFEERWPSIEAEYAYVPYPPTPVAKKPPPIDVRMLERSDSIVYPMAVETKNPLNYPPPAPTLTPTLISRSLVSRQ